MADIEINPGIPASRLMYSTCYWIDHLYCELLTLNCCILCHYYSVPWHGVMDIFNNVHDIFQIDLPTVRRSLRERRERIGQSNNWSSSSSSPVRRGRGQGRGVSRGGRGSRRGGGSQRTGATAQAVSDGQWNLSVLQFKCMFTNSPYEWNNLYSALYSNAIMKC